MNNNHELRHIYSDNIAHKRIFIIGPTPPPLGGVSVHIKRVIGKLKEQHNTVYQINPEQLYRFNFISKTPFKYFAQAWYLINLCAKIIYHQPDVVMYHNFCARNSVPELMILTISSLRAKRDKPAINKFFTIFFIEHDCRHMYQRTNCWKQWFNKYLMHVIF